VTYTLTGADGKLHASATPGSLGGHRGNRGYGRLDCPAALSALARGHYVRQRVFFADEPTAVAAGYRPCGRCLPGRYRAWRAGASAGWPDAPWRSVRFSGAFEAAHMLAYLAARAIPGVERVEGSVYRRTLALSHGPALVELDLRQDAVRIRVLACDARDRRAAAERCRRLLGLDHDPAEASAALATEPLLGRLVAARPGLRVPGTADGSELLIRAIVHQQVSLGAARTVLGRLAAVHGQAMTKHLPDRLFPTPQRLATLRAHDLPMPAARARALIVAAGACLDLRPGRTSRDTLLALPGVGEWTASYVAMRALRDFDAFLPTDLGIRRALEALGQPSDRSSVDAFAERWRPWRAYAAQHLWASAVQPVLLPPSALA
jgi:AraC family transcriptional regulator of adaptative response / DNA-3-methyladenine glycosylase II